MMTKVFQMVKTAVGGPETSVIVEEVKPQDPACSARRATSPTSSISTDCSEQNQSVPQSPTLTAAEPTPVPEAVAPEAAAPEAAVPETAPAAEAAAEDDAPRKRTKPKRERKPLVPPTPEEIEEFIVEFDLDSGASRMLRSHRSVEVQAEVMDWMRNKMSCKRAQATVRNLSSVLVKQMVVTDRKYTERKQLVADCETEVLAQLPAPCQRPLATGPEGSRRSLKMVLNKVTPDNMGAMLHTVLEVCQDEEAEGVLGELLVSFAGRFGHYSGIYSDLVAYVMQMRYGAPALVKALREKAVVSAQDAGKEECKKTHLGLVQFAGALFVRQILPFAHIQKLIEVFLRPDSGEPGMECAIQLFKSVGKSLESSVAGRFYAQAARARLGDLKDKHSRRIQFMVQDLLELAANGWQFRAFEEEAKTKYQLRVQHHYDTNGGETVAPAFEVRVAGQAAY